MGGGNVGQESAPGLSDLDSHTELKRGRMDPAEMATRENGGAPEVTGDAHMADVEAGGTETSGGARNQEADCIAKEATKSTPKHRHCKLIFAEAMTHRNPSRSQ